MNSANNFVGPPDVQLKTNRDTGSAPELVLPNSYNSKIMKKGDILVNFVHIGRRFSGEIQFAIKHPRKDEWYGLIENFMSKNSRITMLDTAQRELVEFPISIKMEEDENHTNIINDFYKVIMSYKERLV